MPEKIISADSHMCELPNLWVERIDRRFRDQAPRVVKDPPAKRLGHFLFVRIFRHSACLALLLRAKLSTNHSWKLEWKMHSRRVGPCARIKDLEVDGIAAKYCIRTCGLCCSA